MSETPPQRDTRAERRWTYGGCHCGAVRFRVELPQPPIRAVTCNCSICTMKGFVHLIVSPARFELLVGAERLSVYRFGTGVAVHRFCERCGVHPFYTPRSHPDDVDVNLRCVEGYDGLELEVEPFDGRRWEQHAVDLPPAHS